MTIFSDDPADWSPISPDDLIVANARTSTFHLRSCEWAQQMSPRNARYFLTVHDARLARCGQCNTCSPSANHAALLFQYPVDQILSAYRNVLALTIEREVNQQVRQLLATPEAIEELLQNEYRLVETENEKWPEGRLVGATVRLRWEDGYIGTFRMVAGDGSGDGKETISIESHTGQAILAREVGDTCEYQGPGIAGMPGASEWVTILSVAVPDDWGTDEC